MLGFMLGVADGRYELNIGSSILTLQGGTDANALGSTQKAILRDWHVGSQNVGNIWKVTKTSQTKYDNLF